MHVIDFTINDYDAGSVCIELEDESGLGAGAIARFRESFSNEFQGTPITDIRRGACIILGEHFTSDAEDRIGTPMPAVTTKESQTRAEDPDQKPVFIPSSNAFILYDATYDKTKNLRCFVIGTSARLKLEENERPIGRVVRGFETVRMLEKSPMKQIPKSTEKRAAEDIRMARCYTTDDVELPLPPTDGYFDDNQDPHDIFDAETAYHIGLELKTLGVESVKENKVPEALALFEKAIKYLEADMAFDPSKKELVGFYISLKLDCFLNASLMQLKLTSPPKVSHGLKAVEYATRALTIEKAGEYVDKDLFKELTPAQKAKALYRRSKGYMAAKYESKALQDLQDAKALLPNDPSIVQALQETQSIIDKNKSKKKEAYKNMFA